MRRHTLQKINKSELVEGNWYFCRFRDEGGDSASLMLYQHDSMWQAAYSGDWDLCEFSDFWGPIPEFELEGE